MDILVACEWSQTVAKAFRDKGHNAFSCDILPGDIDPSYHITGYVEDVLYMDWDMVIAFPPCNHLAVSGARWFAQKRADGRQQKAIEFFMLFANHPAEKVAIENPVGVMSRFYRKPDQIIQPYEFGHPESKKTCLWLKGLAPLVPTDVLDLPSRGYWDNQTPSGQNKLGPSPKRAQLRGKTYEGIARAMADQWG